MKNILEKIYNQIPLSYQEAFNVLVEMGNGEISEIECSGYFSAIGHKPNTEAFADQLETDDVGYLITDGVKTKIKGVYAAGDVSDAIYRQAITAAGTGCAAALEAERLLESEGD